MSEQEQMPEPETPKKRGWPKGKSRGPRKPAPVAPAPPVEPQAPPAPRPTLPPPPTARPDPETEVEICAVEALTTTGLRFNFTCSAFSSNGSNYEFVSFPRRRGFKTIRVLKADQLAALSIEAPEQFFAALRPVVAPQAAAPAPQLRMVPPQETSAPMAYISPIAQQLKDEKANVSRAKPDKYGRPMAEVVGEGGNREVVGASMV